MRLILCLLALVAPGAAAAAELTVGFGDADVSPDLGTGPVYLAGFGQNRKATRVHDPITARAVVLADGGQKVALVSVDVVGLFLPSVERIRLKLPGFAYVLVSATHNHEGPDTLGLWGPSPLKSGVDPAYLARVEDGCAEAVRKADGSRRPAAARVGTASAPELLRDSRRPDVKHDELTVLQFRDPRTDTPVGLLVQWNCHPEVLDSRNTEVTADFPYFVVKRLRETQRCPVAYFTGTVGGLMTTLNLQVKDAAGNDLKDGTFAKAERYGTLVAELTERALAKAVPLSLTPFDVRTRAVLVPVENNLYRLAWQFGTLNRQLYAWEGDPTPRAFTPADTVARPVAVKTEVGYVGLGDLGVAVIPGEIYPELVLGKVQDPPDPGADFPAAAVEPAVYAQIHRKHRMLIGLGNDELGYVIPKRQWDMKSPYCYGLKKAQYGEENSVGPEAAPIICGVFRDLFK